MHKRFVLLLVTSCFVVLGIGLLSLPPRICPVDEAVNSAGSGKETFWKGHQRIKEARKATWSRPPTEMLQVPPLEVDRLRAEHSSEKGKPLRFAERWPVDITPGSHGFWKYESPRARWNLRIEAPEAQNLNLEFFQDPF